MYQALYRKWRPKTFEDVVGQSHITDTLRRQVALGRLSHAYLFTGTRGTGKTTCAKILAKAVNCQNPVDGDPCGQCPACRGIDSGSLLDVLELDAASNNGVDHVRALRDEAIYSPASVKYRVYIIDEVHMLSTPAFNALLKILEEPPSHLIFILATTELHKVPATILSRCQRFAFRRLRPGDIAGRLAYVAGQEGLELRSEAAELIARLADGALRDALSLLDQCAGGGGIIDGARVLDVLGLAGNLQTAELMERVLQRDAGGALEMLHRLYAGGKDVGGLLGELSTLARDLLIRMTARSGGEELLSGGYDSALMDRLSQGVSPTRLLYMTAQLQTVCAALPLSANRRTDAELCLLRLCDESLCGDVTALAARLDRLEAGGIPAAAAAPSRPVPAAASGAPADPPPRDVPVPEEDAPPWDVPAPPAGAEVRHAVPPAQSAPPPVRTEEEQGDTGLWRELVEQYKNQLTPMYWYMLDDAVGAVEGDVMVVRCGDELTRDSLSSPDAAEVIRSVTGQRLGRPVSVRFLVGGGEAAQSVDKLDELIRRGSRYDSFSVK